MPLTTAQTNLLAVIIQTAPAAIMQIVQYLRERGHAEAADDLEVHLSRSDANFKLVIDLAREAQGLPPLPAVDPG
jgi:hypothetical protein